METHQHDVKRGPPSRGIPARESLWLDDIRKRRDEWHYHQNVRLEPEQLLQLAFPEKYQATYYAVALRFYKKLLEKSQLSGEATGVFLKENSFSKATFYNVVLPRLKRLGLVKTSRESFTSKRSTQKFYTQTTSLSTQFSDFWEAIAKEHRAIVETARIKSDRSSRA